MSKRSNEGDVIANRISLLEAKGQKLLATLYGSRPDWDTTDSATKAPDEDDDKDLKQNYAHDRIGLGGIIPTDIEDGSFTKRIPTSDDKLLQQLIGKKKAKAHIIARQEAARPNTVAKAQRYQKPTKKEESDDEEDGRAATFKSKRRRKETRKAVEVNSDDEDEETRAKRLAASTNTKDREDGSASKEEVENILLEPTGPAASLPTGIHPSRLNNFEGRPGGPRGSNRTPQGLIPTSLVVRDAKPKKEDEGEEAEVTQSAPKRAKTKPKSFLDEILADRSKKKSKKSKA